MRDWEEEALQRVGRRDGQSAGEVRNMLASAPSEPCNRCGVRADVGCKHRPAEGALPIAMDPRRNKAKRDGRLRDPGK